MTIHPDDDILSKTADAGKSVHLSASAGSGKTRALKERYLTLLDRLDRSGLNIDQAVAITFTDKAAAEIKERVMHDLPEPMLKKIIRGRQDLRISTIHSFCMNLLKRYPLEAGLPPDFGVLDARDQANKIQTAIEDALEESDSDPGIMAPLRDFSADELIAMLGFLISIRCRIERMEIDAGGPDNMLQAVNSGMRIKKTATELDELVAGTEWRSIFHRMERILNSQGDYYEECRGKEHLLLSKVRTAAAALDTAGSLETVYFTAQGEPRKNPYIPKKAYAGKDRDEYEKVFQRIQELLGTFRSSSARIQAGQEALSLLRLYHRAGERYQESKIREGLLDFDDLEIYTYRLLQKPEALEILYWLDRKILHFLVDEFQDTSDIQWAILNKLTEEIFAGQGADKPVRPTLFVVGDEKQSIYRFREANYRLIENVRNKMVQNIPAEFREVLSLDKNFRSVPEIIETVNQVFGGLWKSGYTPSGADRKQHRGSVRLIELTPSFSPEKPAGSPEAAVLAREIASLIGSGTIVFERTSENGDASWKERPAEYGDCAVLIQSRTSLKEYEAALRAEGIPFRVVGGIGFYEEDEIQAILNVLFFLWNRDDKLSLAAALKSPLLDISDKDLYDLLTADGNMSEALRHHRPNVWNLLDSWKQIAGLVPLSDLIHRIIQDTGSYIRFGRRNRQAIFNLDKLLDTAREFDRRGYTTLQDFVEWIKSIRETEQREATADINLPGFQGAVSVMTVHKAKGLEFPIVFLPGMNQQPRSLASGPLAILDSDDGVRVAIKDPHNPVYREMWDQEREELRREHQRLLYVAMTRARDHLVMIGTLSNGKTAYKQDGWLSYLHETGPRPLFDDAQEAKPGLLVYSFPPTKQQTHPDHPVPPPDKRGQGGVASREGRSASAQEVDIEALVRNIAPLPRSESLEWKRATDFIEQNREDDLVMSQYRKTGAIISVLTRGSLLHRCLEDLAKNGSYDLRRISREFPEIVALEKEALDRFLQDAESVLHAVVQNNDLAWIFEKNPQAYTELPFLMKRGHSLISGKIDRVVIRDGKGFVIDYKSILIENEEDLKAWKDHYRPQLNIYCEAVKGLFGIESVEGYLLFLDSNRLERTT